jgi:hypothetical protein
MEQISSHSLGQVRYIISTKKKNTFEATLGKIISIFFLYNMLFFMHRKIPTLRGPGQ